MDTKVVTRAFIENEEGAVMLGKRTKGAGAKPNEGEELSETVVREVKEETGLDIAFNHKDLLLEFFGES